MVTDFKTQIDLFKNLSIGTSISRHGKLYCKVDERHWKQFNSRGELIGMPLIQEVFYYDIELVRVLKNSDPSARKPSIFAKTYPINMMLYTVSHGRIVKIGENCWLQVTPDECSRISDDQIDLLNYTLVSYPMERTE